MSDWIEWKGGPSPVTDDQVVEVRYRDGIRWLGNGWGSNCWWHHLTNQETGADIISYRIIKKDK